MRNLKDPLPFMVLPDLDTLVGFSTIATALLSNFVLLILLVSLVVSSLSLLLSLYLLKSASTSMGSASLFSISSEIFTIGLNKNLFTGTWGISSGLTLHGYSRSSSVFLMLGFSSIITSLSLSSLSFLELMPSSLTPLTFLLLLTFLSSALDDDVYDEERESLD